MWKQKLTPLVILAVIAAGGYAFLAIAPRAIDDYRRAAELSPTWGNVYLAVMIASGLACLALSCWTVSIIAANTRRKSALRTADARTPSQMSAKQKQSEIESRLAETRAIAADAELSPQARVALDDSWATLNAKRESQKLEIIVFGTISSGKSSLLNALAGRDVFRTDARGGTTVTRNEVPWPGGDRVVLVDTPGLAEINGQVREELAKQAARDADLVLLVTDGPLKDFEFELLKQLSAMEKPVVVCLNKADWFRDADRTLLEQQLAEQVARFVPRENIAVVRAQPGARVRTRVLADGSQSDEAVEVVADISALAEKMQAIVKADGRDLLLANLLLQSRGLVREAKAHVRTRLDERAGAIVDRAMWQAGAAGALSPLPVIDLAAGLGITSNMVLQLARVYGQPIDFDTVSRLLGELGKQLAAVAGANVAGPMAASAIASMLKTVPGVGTISGGLLQGLVQVLVTRWIGKVFIVYFRDETQGAATDLASVARSQWAQVTRPEELAKLVKAGLSRLGSKAS